MGRARHLDVVDAVGAGEEARAPELLQVLLQGLGGLGRQAAASHRALEVPPRDEVLRLAALKRRDARAPRRTRARCEPGGGGCRRRSSRGRRRACPPRLPPARARAPGGEKRSQSGRTLALKSVIGGALCRRMGRPRQPYPTTRTGMPSRSWGANRCMRLMPLRSSTSRTSCRVGAPVVAVVDREAEGEVDLVALGRPHPADREVLEVDVLQGVLRVVHVAQQPVDVEADDVGDAR